MTKEIETVIIKVLEDCGIDPASRGFGYILDTIIFLIEEGREITEND